MCDMCCTWLAGNAGLKKLPKIRHLGTIALTAEICWRVWGTPANFNGFRVLATLLHGTLVVGVSQTLRRWTEGAIYIRQGGHHVGHWPTFLVLSFFSSPNLNGRRLDVALVLQFAEIQDAKNRQKWAPLHNFVGLYLHN